MAWYRTYRPRTLDGLHLTAVRDKLVGMQEKGFFPQVLLFTGPRGAGKTSAARAIAAILNAAENKEAVTQVYREQRVPSQLKKHTFKNATAKDELVDRIFRGGSYCVLEMDAASNRGIDDIRELQEKLQIPPLEGVMTVVILDEVHMLTREAFNALLKLLEEPPNHALFIMATTEPHKIPETIKSRSTEVSFSKASVAELLEAMQRVLESEKISSETTALEQIAQRVDGSFRDAIKQIEELSNQLGKITLEGLHASQHNLTEESLSNLITALLQKKPKQVMEWFGGIRLSGVDDSTLIQALLQFLYKHLEQDDPQLSPKVALFLIKEILKLPVTSSSPIPHLALEVELLHLIDRSQNK